MWPEPPAHSFVVVTRRELVRSFCSSSHGAHRSTVSGAPYQGLPFLCSLASSGANCGPPKTSDQG
eukprot:scaffold140882_cov187-Phaeocystis_antarctica.AAC.1